MNHVEEGDEALGDEQHQFAHALDQLASETAH